MATQIFVNLPVKDLNKSVEFFTKLGYTFNPQFTNEQATCMIVSDTIFVMLLVESFFKTFSDKEIADSSKVVESIICLSTDGRDAVDTIISKAVEAGATTPKDKIDYGFMYSGSFEDIDGHQWEYMWMDPAGPPQQQ
ncbi:VOC family protein [Mucilaginibacter gilvus]|uniref:Glyoxalase/bleomycin resistance/extradiol dioxygenase family protein n=1 Tax=Mucilaginibacter gilvus TaxID=2305909 RepID=A0A3S3V4K3_9SPHI|nr:VOC family protein [Mucilaginibacter gilvus]RWY55498.1 glyoxalase/bleomycin resistance/extradiol dioxygenase family protein [Mucilaginibacter gilvus]